MKKQRQLLEGKPALELLEEAFHLVRGLPITTLFYYYVGSLPFVLSLLYFLADMSQSAFAQERLAGGAVIVSLLFIWMKTWQSIFARNLLARLSGEPAPRWTLRRWVAVAVTQSVLQPAGLFLLPVAIVLFAPFGWLYAFFQSATALGGDVEPVRVVFRRARRQMALWPVQNHGALVVLKIFAFVILMNLVTGVLAVPFLLKTLLGIENNFTRMMTDPKAFLGLALNTTFITGVLGLTYLCYDPLSKAFYVLRCFYGESLQTGQDLKSELHNCSRVAVVTAVLLSSALLSLSLPACARASQTSRAAAAPAAGISGSELNRSLEEVIGEREYSWRLPRPKKVPTEKEAGSLQGFFAGIGDTLERAAKAVGRWVKSIVEWFGKFQQPRTTTEKSGGAWISQLYLLVYVLSAALLVLIILLIFRLWKRRRRPPEEVTAQAVVPVPDLQDENVAADQLPEDGWLQLARELIGNGELRLALRAFYLASLAHLAHRQLITIAKFKSNLDYERELQRRGHALPDLFSLFRHNVGVFDRVWYGLHEVNRDMLDSFARDVEKIRAT